MKEQCSVCSGSGEILGKERKCPTCNGYGSKKVSLTELTEEGKPKPLGPPCKDCNGTGQIGTPTTCPKCGGGGFEFFCEVCHRPTDEKKLMCPDCYRDPIVYQIKQPIDFKLLESQRAILGHVSGQTNEGVLVDLGCNLSGVIPGFKIPRQVHIQKGMEVAVMIVPQRVREILNRKGLFDLVLLRLQNYRVVPVRRDLKPMSINRILSGRFENKHVVLNAELISVRQTSGPTTFTFADETGETLSGVAFVEAGKRAYPEINEGLIVQVVARLSSHRGAPQLDIQDLYKLPAKDARDFFETKERLIGEKTAIAPDFKFLVESELLEKLRPEMVKVAQRIRRALFNNQPVLLKYHHPCVDGACAGIALELAILGLVDKQWEDDTRGILKKIPEREPIYAIQSATRDVLTAVEEEARYGYPLPLIVLLDLGSSQSETSFAMQKLGYNLDVIVVDHHTIEEGVSEHLFAHVNPHYHTTEYALSSGMLAVEIARMVNPDPSFSDKIKHLAFISGLSDRVSGTELNQYQELVTDNYSQETALEIVHALNYTTYNLRFSDGSLMFYDILGIGRNQRAGDQKSLIQVLGSKAQVLLDKELTAARTNAVRNNVTEETTLVALDLANYVHKGSYPPPSKVIGILHDEEVRKAEKNVVTLGVGPDFLIFRSSQPTPSFSSVITNLEEKFPHAGIDGGGHETLGTVKFYPGFAPKIVQAVRDMIKSKPAPAGEE